MMLLDLIGCWEYDIVVQGIVERIRFSSMQPVLDNPEYVVAADDSSVVSCNPNSCHCIKPIRLQNEGKNISHNFLSSAFLPNNNLEQQKYQTFADSTGTDPSPST